MKLVVILLLVVVGYQSAFGQGPLTPPGPPAPTMKTLAQVEPRTPITNATAVTISASGSYYLTTNIAVIAGDAITITADNVTLDLNGFTVSSTEASPTGTGILLSGGRAHIHILNGHIRGNVTDSAGFFTGSGFGEGIYYSGGAPRSVRVTGVSVSGCGDNGIWLGVTNATVVESCTVANVGGRGIVADSVADSVAYDCGFAGIYVTTAINSYGQTDGREAGLSAFNTANNCYGVGGPAGLYANEAINCEGYSIGNGIGLNAYYAASNCRGYSAGGNTGLSANEAHNCEGYSNGSGTGLNAYYTASNCRGYSAGDGTGLSANEANNCEGYSNGNGVGLNTVYAANNCRGYSTGSGTGLSANEANNCEGRSSTGTGLRAQYTASNCYGKCDSSSGYGLVCGDFGTTYGIAIGSTGITSGLFSTDLVAFVANSCVGHNLVVAHKYNMP